MDDVLFYSGIGNKRIDHEIPVKGVCDKLPDRGGGGMRIGKGGVNVHMVERARVWRTEESV
jgi:hypothetical protein